MFSLKTILSLGSRKGMSHADIREIESLNLSLLIALVTSAAGFALFLPEFFSPIVLLIPVAYACIVLASFWFSVHGKRTMARIVFWASSITSLLLVILVSAPSSFVHWYLLVLLVASFHVFPSHQRVVAIISAFLCAIAFLVFQFLPVGGWGLRLAVSPEDILIARVVNAGGMLAALGFFGYNLSRSYARLSDGLDNARERADSLLRNVLPQPIIEKLKENRTYIAERTDRAAVFFADIAGFTQFCNNASAENVVHTLNSIFTVFDRIAAKHGVEKIKTIGDSYMAVVGAPASVEEPERVMAEFALEALAAFQSQFSRTMSLRIGLHSGPLVAGIIGEKRFSYDLWGSTVNIASRLETHGMPGKIHVSDQFKDRCNQGFTFVPRGFLELKGVGKMETFFLEP